MLLSITRHYTELHRRYHNISHPTKMIEIGQAVYDLTDAQIAAIWYHDVIYVPGDKLNEENSAKLFMRHFEPRWSKERKFHLELVTSIILDTKHHLPSSEEAKAVLDLDLLGLGNTFQDYWRTAISLREEYYAFSDEQWYIGRTKFLESMLERDIIFWTDFGSTYDGPARLNMQRELKLLQNGTARYV